MCDTMGSVMESLRSSSNHNLRAPHNFQAGSRAVDDERGLIIEATRVLSMAEFQGVDTSLSRAWRLHSKNQRVPTHAVKR